MVKKGTQSWRQWVLFLLVSIATLAIASYFAAPWAVNSMMVAPRLKQQSESEHKLLPSLLADQKSLQSTYLNAGSGHKRDAGIDLNKKIAWRGSTEPGPRQPLELPQAVLDTLKSWKSSWLEHSGDTALNQIDTSWMNTLSAYDHWDIHRDCSGCVNSEVRTRGLADHLVPDYGQLLAWAKVRLLKGLQASDIANAASEVRQLARLVMSQESLVSAMTATAMYRLERLAFDFAAGKKLVIDPSWKPLTIRELDNAKRACWATGTMFSGLRSTETIKRVYQAKGPVFCKCAGLAEGLASGSLLGSALRRAVDAKKERVMTLIADQAKECRLNPWRAEWKRQQFSRSVDTSFPVDKLPLRFKKLVGAVLIAVGTPDPWYFYQPEPKHPPP